MGSHISPIVAKLCMEDFEIKTINSAVYPPRIWKRFVDDTFVVIGSARKEKFLDNINNMDPPIQFSTEDAKSDGSLPFLDTVVLPQPDNSLLTTVYRKPTHTDLYLAWDSHHHLSAKYSVINTLKHRARTVCSNQQLLKEEEDHLNKALNNCKYSTWALNRASIRSKKNNRTKNINTNKNSNGNNKNKPYIVVPYMKGLSESCKNICRKHGTEMYFKGGNTIKKLLVHTKNKGNILEKCGVIYRYKCGMVDCEEEYIEESGRTSAERFREHTRAPSPIHDHFSISGHEISLDNFSILGREDLSMDRAIKEAVLIRVNDPSLNRNIGKY